MTKRKTLKIVIKNFSRNFNCEAQYINKRFNPYSNILKEEALKNNIPLFFLDQTQIKENNGKLTLIFNWTIEKETPKKDKIKVVAYIKEKDGLFSIFLEKNIKELYLNKNEVENDYDLENAFLIENEKEYIESLNIDFCSIYGKTIKKILKSYVYEGFLINNKIIKEFLKTYNIKETLISETPDSITDTAPREIICDLYEDFCSKNKYRK